jgi:hypothetical protein
MKKISCFCLFFLVCGLLLAQKPAVDSNEVVMVKVSKDPRLDLLAKAEADINNMANRFAKGYRLFILKTNNRDYAMKVRAYLLQSFPDEKVIMTYQSPFIKMKFGDFEEKKDAEKVRDNILASGIVTNNIYVIPDTIELKPDRINKDDQ